MARIEVLVVVVRTAAGGGVSAPCRSVPVSR